MQSPDPQCEHRFGVVNACIAAVLLAVALGAVAVEFGFYKAFDDSWFDLDRSALPSVLAMLGLGTQPANANTNASATPRAPANPAR